MARPKKQKPNLLQDLVNKANGIETPEQESPEVEEAVAEFDYDVETFVPKKDKSTGFYNIYHIFLNVETLETHVEVEKTTIKSKSAIHSKISDRLRKLYQKGLND